MKITIKKQTLKNLYIIIFLFVLIYAPPFLPKTNLILAILSFGGIIFFYNGKYSNVLIKSGQMQWVITIIIFIAYALLMICVNSIFFNDLVQIGHYTALFNRFLVLTVTVISCNTYLICYMEKYRVSIQDFVKFLVTVGMIQTVFVYSSFFIEGIHNVFLFFLRKFTDSSLYTNTWYLDIRSYGFANTLVDTFGLGMGLIAGIAFIYGVFHKKIYIFYSILIAVAGVIDARTTIVIYLLSIVVVMMYFITKIKVRLLLSGLTIIGVGLLVINKILSLIESVNKHTYTWLMAGIRSVEQLLQGQETSDSLSKLFSDNFWQIPKPFQIVFGSGHSLYGAKGYRHSDVGYINDLWFVGIVGMVFLYGSIAILLIRYYKTSKNIEMKLCAIFFALALLVFNVKGSAIGYNSGMATLFTMIYVITYFNLQYSKQERMK